jgi:IS605 OrfB family transposase
VQSDDSYGIIGVDINVGFLAVTRTDRFGNPVESFNVPFVTHGKSSDQSLDAARKAAASIVAYAAKHGLPIVCENLDFSRKKKSLSDERNARYARMLSSFAYSSISAALESACARSGIALKRVNPAYTSLMGRVKFARRYGLSVHAAAALCIARRAMKLSESVPFNEDGTVSAPSDDGSVVTLRAPARKRVRHVWSVWSAINTEKKKVFATHGSPGRKSRPPHGSGRARGSGPVGSSGTFPAGSSSTMPPGLWGMSQGESSAGRRSN